MVDDLIIDQTVDQIDYLSDSRIVDQIVGQIVDQIVGQIVNHIVGQIADQIVG